VLSIPLLKKVKASINAGLSALPGKVRHLESKFDLNSSCALACATEFIEDNCVQGCAVGVWNVPVKDRQNPAWPHSTHMLPAKGRHKV
jgi:hypothetical protein